MNVANANASIPHLPLSTLDLAAHAVSTQRIGVTYQTRVMYLCSVVIFHCLGLQRSMVVDQLEQTLVMYTHEIPII